MKSVLITTLFMFICLIGSAQEKYLDIEPDGKLNLSGKWHGECAFEYVNLANTKQCDLCPFIIDTKDRGRGELKDIEMIFSYDSILIKRPNESITVPYTMNSDTHTIQFLFKGNKEVFRVFYNKRNVILEDQDGFVITLKRAS